MVSYIQGKEAEVKSGSRYGDRLNLSKGELLQWVAEFEAEDEINSALHGCTVMRQGAGECDRDSPDL